MLILGIDSLQHALDDLRKVTAFADAIRRHFVDDPDLAPAATGLKADRYLVAKGSLPSSAVLQIHNHCAGVTRLYAIYEAYIFELIGAWLNELCQSADKWGELPEDLCKNYRNGIGLLLQRFGGPRTAHLTELALTESLGNALAGETPLRLIPDAFFLDLNNLRESELASLLGRVGLGDLTRWLIRYPPLVTYCEQNGCTVNSQLKALVEYRNEAAHAAIAIDEVLGVSDFMRYIEFVELLCQGVSAFVRSSIVARSRKKGTLIPIGQVTEFFSGPGASIVTMHVANVHQGMTVLASSATECYPAVVQSIEIDGQGKPAVTAAEGQELGVRFEPPVRRGDILVAVAGIAAPRVPVESAVESGAAASGLA